jgi:hypothetical protein
MPNTAPTRLAVYSSPLRSATWVGRTTPAIRLASGLKPHACPAPPAKSRGAVTPTGHPPRVAMRPVASSAAPIASGPMIGRRSRMASLARVHVRLALAKPVA